MKSTASALHATLQVQEIVMKCSESCQMIYTFGPMLIYTWAHLTNIQVIPHMSMRHGTHMHTHVISCVEDL